MNKQDLSRDEQLALWKLVLQRLELMSVPAPLSQEAAREILASWLPRRGHETLGERIRRAEGVGFEPLTEIVRLAADSGPDLPLPDPGRPLETGPQVQSLPFLVPAQVTPGVPTQTRCAVLIAALARLNIHVVPVNSLEEAVAACGAAGWRMRPDWRAKRLSLKLALHGICGLR